MKRQFIWLLILLIGWELIATFEVVNVQLLPPLSQVLKRLIGALFFGNLGWALLQSLLMILLALLVSTCLAVMMSFFDYTSVRTSALFDLLSAMLHPLPGIALLPIVIMWVGIGGKAVFVIMLHAMVWSMFLNIKAGIGATDSAYIEVARNNGATALQLFIHVLLPCSRISMITGLRISWSRGWRALISAEMIFGAISSLGGVGWFIYERRAFMDSTGVFSGILLVTLVGIVIEQFVFPRLIQDDAYKL